MGDRLCPAGVLDVNGQQVDLRQKHSWTMRLGEVETPELLEVLAVNAAAPFVLNGKLRGLMARTAAAGRPSTSRDDGEDAAAGDDGDGDGDGDGGGEDDTSGGGDDDASGGGKQTKAAAGEVGGGGKKSKSKKKKDGEQAEVPGRAFIVNVSAMEGKFYRYKTANHPHTNMAKAALNMVRGGRVLVLAPYHATHSYTHFFYR